MKKAISIFLLLAFVFSLVGCNSVMSEDRIGNTKIDIGESEIFSEEDRQSAVEFILNDWKDEKTITKLYSITYAGDEKSKYETEYYSDVDNMAYDEIIVFYIDFHTSKDASAEGFNENEDYTGWAQMLGRDNGGKWVFVTGGYA